MSEQICDCGYDKGDGIEYVCYQCDACKEFIATREYDGNQLRAEIAALRESRDAWRAVADFYLCPYKAPEVVADGHLAVARLKQKESEASDEY